MDWAIFAQNWPFYRKKRQATVQTIPASFLLVSWNSRKTILVVHSLYLSHSFLSILCSCFDQNIPAVVLNKIIELFHQNGNLSTSSSERYFSCNRTKFVFIFVIFVENSIFILSLVTKINVLINNIITCNKYYSFIIILLIDKNFYGFKCESTIPSSKRSFGFFYLWTYYHIHIVRRLIIRFVVESLVI